MSILTQNSERTFTLNPNAIEFHPGLQCHPIRQKQRRRSKFNPQVAKVLSAVDRTHLPKVPQTKGQKTNLQNYLEKMGVMQKESQTQMTEKDDKPQIVQQLFKQVQRTRLISSVY
jgi:hypothetical protein